MDGNGTSPRPPGFDRAESNGADIGADRLTETPAPRLGPVVLACGPPWTWLPWHLVPAPAMIVIK
jgi:hypothetical protein